MRLFPITVRFELTEAKSIFGPTPFGLVETVRELVGEEAHLPLASFGYTGPAIQWSFIYRGLSTPIIIYIVTNKYIAIGVNTIDAPA